MTTEALRRDMQIQFPYWGWNDGQPRDEAASTYLQRALEHAEAGDIGKMEAMVSMALRTRDADFLDATEIRAMRIHGYGVFVNNTLDMLFGLEDTYYERRNDAGQLAIIDLIDTREQRNATAEPEERAEAMVKAAQEFDLGHLTFLDFHCPQVERAQEKLDELLGNVTLAA